MHWSSTANSTNVEPYSSIPTKKDSPPSQPHLIILVSDPPPLVLCRTNSRDCRSHCPTRTRDGPMGRPLQTGPSLTFACYSIICNVCLHMEKAFYAQTRTSLPDRHRSEPRRFMFLTDFDFEYTDSSGVVDIVPTILATKRNIVRHTTPPPCHSPRL